MSLFIETMIQNRELSPAAREMDAADVLRDWAEANAVQDVELETFDKGKDKFLQGTLCFEDSKDGVMVLLTTVNTSSESGMDVFLLDPSMKDSVQHDHNGIWKGAKMLRAI